MVFKPVHCDMSSDGSFLRSENAFPPMEVTPLGMGEMYVSVVDPARDTPPMLVSVGGSVTIFSEVQ